MNIVLGARTILAYSLISFGVIIPRMLVSFGLEHEYLVTMTSFWFIFIVFLVALAILFYRYLLNPRGFIFGVTILIIVSAIAGLLLGV